MNSTRVTGDFIHFRLPRIASVLALLLCLASSQVICQRATARISIDATKVEGPISRLLYGQFMEFMFEGIKGGLQAELIRNRSFEEAPNAIGLSRYWERYPDGLRPLLTSININGAKIVGPNAQVETLTADSLATFNSFSTPDAVRVKTWKVRVGADFKIELPRHSISVIRLGVN